MFSCICAALVVLSCLNSASAASCDQYRYEFLLEFETVAVASNQNHGEASDQLFTTTWKDGKIFGDVSVRNFGGAKAVFETTTNSSGSMFFARGNITFGNETGLIYIEASDNGQAFSQSQISYGAIPYLITGGEGQLANAKGSAADIFVSQGNSKTFSVFVLGIFYVPVTESNRRIAIPASAPSLDSSAYRSRKLKIPGFDVTTFNVKFTSQPNQSSENFAYGFAQTMLSYSDVPNSLLNLETPLSAPILYTSKTGVPAPGKFNESGIINLPASDTGFSFTSTTDGTVISSSPGNIMGSIAYHLSDGTGSLAGAFGSMVDVFESSVTSAQFPIQTFGILMVPTKPKQQ